MIPVLLDRAERQLYDLLPLLRIVLHEILVDGGQVSRVLLEHDEPVRIRSNPRWDHRELLRDDHHREHAIDDQMTPVEDELCEERVELVSLQL